MSPLPPNDRAPADEKAGRFHGAEIATPVAMVVAHPGHELLAFGWLAAFRPSLFVVTDGSGRSSDPRIEATGGLLRDGLGTPGSVFGRWTDRDLYEALYEGRFGPFLELRDELVESWCNQGYRTVICDAYEGRILMHDVVQIIVSAAVAACRGRNLEIDHFELPIYLGSGDDRPGNPAEAAAFAASDAILQKKIEAARGYESAVVRHEVEEFLRLRSAEAFRVETLFHSIHRTADDLAGGPQPAWEIHGEQLMQQGIYDHVIRLGDHLVPLARALDRPSKASGATRVVGR